MSKKQQDRRKRSFSVSRKVLIVGMLCLLLCTAQYLLLTFELRNQRDISQSMGASPE